MASNGLATFLFAPLDEEKSSYGSVKKLAGAISYKEALSKNNASVYADNVKKFEDTSVNGGKITLGVDDDDPAIFAPLLGKKTRKVTVGEASKEIYVGNSEDIPIPVGFGLIEYGRNEKGAFYQPVFYPKVVFAPYDKEAETKKENNDYKTPTVEGTLYNIGNGDYKYDNRYDTLLEAVQVLYALFGAEVPEDVLANIQSNVTENTEGEDQTNV